MLGRLWWKEMRTLWPLWPTLFAVAVALQGLLLLVQPEIAKTGSLLMIGYGWACLYALVSSSAAFAGEREMGTLVLLDALSVRRWELWFGKVSFMLVSSLGLLVVMLALGGLGSTGVEDQPRFAFAVGMYGTLLFEIIAWSLFWSALLANPVLVASFALVCIYAVSEFASGGNAVQFASESAIPTRALMAATALGASALLLVFQPVAGWSARIQSEMDLEGLNSDGAQSLKVKWPRGRRTLRGVLGWKTRREGWKVWLIASLVGWGALLWMGFQSRSSEVHFPVAVLWVGATLVAGVNVFGAQTQFNSQRFLLHRGISPGAIWWSILLFWGTRLALTILGVLVILTPFLGSMYWSKLVEIVRYQPRVMIDTQVFAVAVGSVVAFANIFTIGMLTGMVFPRRITAAMISLLIMLMCVPLQVGLVSTFMVPGWAGFLLPISLLVVSRLWTSDWLDPREKPNRWLRLASFVLVPAVSLPCAYIAYRAWGLPDPGPVPLASSPTFASHGFDTIRAYSGLAMDLRSSRVGMGASIEAPEAEPGQSQAEEEPGRESSERKSDEAILLEIEKVTKMPPIRFGEQNLLEIDVSTSTIFSDVGTVVAFLHSTADSQLKRGEAELAWKSIVAQYRIVAQLIGGGPTVSFVCSQSLRMDQNATFQALEWVRSDSVAPGMLKKALDDLRVLTPRPSIAQRMHLLAPLMERTLDLSGPDLAVALYGPSGRPILPRMVETMLLFPSWERERARRYIRTEIKAALAGTSSSERRSLFQPYNVPRYQELLKVSPLVTVLYQNQVFSESFYLRSAIACRRGLQQVIALRAWKEAHNGVYPKSLDALVPEWLDSLPVDPYSPAAGQPFQYFQSSGKSYVSVSSLLLNSSPRLAERIPEGQWVLSSVGYDGNSQSSPSNPGSGDDLIFLLP